MMNDNLKILFFDCNTSESKMDTWLCVNKGVSPIYAMNSGEEVLECIYKHLPDVVVMDLFMPRLDSIGVLHELKQKPPAKQPLIVVLSSVCESNLDSKIKQMLYDKGADMLIFKPFEFEDLLDSIIAKL